MNAKLEAKLKSLPRGPGVYFHKSADGVVIYVGKAAVLKNRIRQYFHSRKDMDAKTLALVNEIDDVDWIETESEIDALFLESEMIKRYRPRFNILLRDDKSQLFVRIDIKSDIPYVGFTRNPLDDDAEYYGPYYNGYAVKKALRYLRKVFPYYIKPMTKVSLKKPDLDYHLGLSPGIGSSDKTIVEYKNDLRKLIRYLKGERKTLQREIENGMKQAANNHEYELATCFRNQLHDLLELNRSVVFGREEFLDISKDQGLSGLRELLNLKNTPRRVEGYDVSHMSGTHSVASMVVMTNGVVDKKEYRKFRLGNKNDDYAQMRTVIQRRLKHINDWGRPDLVVLDGGVGQLKAVADLLSSEKIPFIGRNKSGDHTRNAKMKLVIPRGKTFETVKLDGDSHIARLIARLDDEAHRFAVSYHTVLKRSGQIKNTLEEIPGIGPSTRKKLLRAFGSISGVRSATEEEITVYVGPFKASIVKRYIN